MIDWLKCLTLFAVFTVKTAEKVVNRKNFCWCMSVLAVLHLVTSASAQSYPDRPVKILVTNPAGGTADLFARIVSRGLQARLNQPFVVENRPGAAGLIATEAVARAKPDGYTLLVTNENSITILPAIRSDIPYDPATAFTPIRTLGALPFFLVANASLGVNSVSDVIKLARTRGNKLNYGSTGEGGASHLLTERFSSAAGISMVHIPYKGGPDAMASLIAGETDLFFSIPTTALGQLSNSRLKFLAMTGARRSEKAPDVPTLTEQGIRNFEVNSWFGLLGPAGMPPGTLSAISRGVAEVTADPATRAIISGQGAEVVDDTPAEFSIKIQDDLAAWKKTATALGLNLK